MEEFLGESFDFWVGIREELEKEGTTDLYREIIKLRGKINFYESRIKQLVTIMDQD